MTHRNNYQTLAYESTFTINTPHDFAENATGDRQRLISRKQVLPNYLFFCLCVCSFGASFQVGFQIAIFNTPISVFKEFFNQTHSRHHSNVLDNHDWVKLWSITNGLMPFGGIFGGLASGFMADYFGRRNSLIFVNFFVILSVFLTVLSKLAHTYVTIIIGRFLAGIFCGLFTGISPLYLSEIAPKNLRGAAGTLHQFSIVIGILVSNVLGLPQLLGSNELWPYLIGVALLPCFAHILLLPICPETPKFLYINMNKPLDAHETLKKLRGVSCEEEILLELEELSAEKALRTSQNSIKFYDLFNMQHLRRPLLITIVIQASQQFSGINSIAIYSTNMFISIGLDERTWAIYATILIDIFKVSITLVCMILIDRAGRRSLLLIGLFGMAVFSFALALIPALFDGLIWSKYLTVVSAVIYVIFFSIGPGSIPWLITAELFGSDTRGKATSVAVFTNWLSNFIVTTSIPLISDQINNYIYLLFSFFIIVSLVFIYFKVPETKKKSIEEISRYFVD